MENTPRKKYKLRVLPTTLQPNALYYIKPIGSEEVTLYVTDKDGIPKELKDESGVGGTNLTYTASPTQGTVVSDTGSDAVIPLANGIDAGLSENNLTTAEKNLINTALQTSDLSDTKAEFNAQLADGDFLFVGDVTQYTNEQAQDAVGGILTDTSTINFTYDDVSNQISADVQANSITANELSNTIPVSEFVNDADYATETYVDNKIVQTITNGATATAPSEDAVFDALALKQDSLGYTPENVANKQNSLAVDGTGVKYPTVDATNAGLSTKQATLISGTNIKTIEGQSILGSGDINLNNKLDKVTTVDVEKVYIKNADGTQGVKATSELKEIIEGYLSAGVFYQDALHTITIAPEGGKIYIDLSVTPATQYRWSGSAYVQIGGGKKTTTIKIAGVFSSSETRWLKSNAYDSFLQPTNSTDVTLAFASDNISITSHQIPFNHKIVGCFFNCFNNVGSTTNLDVAVVSFEFPNNGNNGLAIRTNSTLLARKNITFGSSVSPNFEFLGTELNTSYNGNKGALVKLYTKNLSAPTVVLTSFQYCLTLLVEEI